MSALQRMRAAMGGYFALPCPLCGQEFYGFQGDDCDSIAHPDPAQAANGVGRMICPTCSKEGRGRWPEHYKRR